MFYQCQFHSCTARDLFDMMNSSELTFTSNTALKYGVDSKLKLCAKIFTYCFYLIIMDIIENGISFTLPTGKRIAYLHMSTIAGERFKEMYRTGSFEGLDFLATNFTANEIKYRWLSKNGYREKPVYLDKKTKEYLYSLINSGKSY